MRRSSSSKRNFSRPITTSSEHFRRIMRSLRQTIPESCDAVDALLRIELLEKISDWLAKKAAIVGCQRGCTSSSSVLFSCWKEVFPNEDTTRFDLVEELRTLPQKPLVTILACVGKPLQSQDNLFVTKWVAIFKERGLRDDVTVRNLEDAC